MWFVRGSGREAPVPLEIETKFAVPDLDAVRGRLAGAGAVRIGGGLERNWILDDAEGSLFRRRILFRLRDEGERGSVLTVKKPAREGKFKTREEVNAAVESVGKLLAQMEMLGYRTKWRYEKRRETWRWLDCLVCLDECPEIGAFVEIEGEPPAIRAAAAGLGLDLESHIDDNYLDLWQNHLDALGQPRRDMGFGNAETCPEKGKPGCGPAAPDTERRT